MKSSYINCKSASWLIAGVSVAILLFAAWILGRDLAQPIQLLKTIPLVLMGDTVVIFVFVKWLWKFPTFRHWLVLIPDLNGTWEGEIRSSWVNPETDTKIAPIPSIISIKQSLFCISCVARTGEMKSYSFLAGFILDQDQQKRFLSYSYDSDPLPLVRDRSSPHKGTALLEIEGEDDLRLNGEYWTARKTTGEMTFTRVSKEPSNGKELNLKAHPLKSQQD